MIFVSRNKKKGVEGSCLAGSGGSGRAFGEYQEASAYSHPFLNTRPPSTISYYYIVLYHIILHFVLPYCTTLQCTIIKNIVSSILYYILLYPTIPYNIALYHNLQHCAMSYLTMIQHMLLYDYNS